MNGVLRADVRSRVCGVGDSRVGLARGGFADLNGVAWIEGGEAVTAVVEDTIHRKLPFPHFSVTYK